MLIIEDNRDAADSLSEALALSGHRVAVAYDGETAWRRPASSARRSSSAISGLPEMDGYAVALAFRADDVLKSAFLVAVTGYALPEDLHAPARRASSATSPSRRASRSSRNSSRRHPGTRPSHGGRLDVGSGLDALN